MELKLQFIFQSFSFYDSGHLLTCTDTLNYTVIIFKLQAYA